MKKYLQLHESFYHKIFILEQNLRNHESFLPQKFGAIRYPYIPEMYSYIVYYLYLYCNAWLIMYVCTPCEVCTIW